MSEHTIIEIRPGKVDSSFLVNHCLNLMLMSGPYLLFTLEDNTLNQNNSTYYEQEVINYSITEFLK